MVTTDIHTPNSLFEDVQMQQVFPDGKTFVDCIPKLSLEEINARYEAEKNKKGFKLEEFILTNFDVPVAASLSFTSNTSKPVEENIEKL